MTFKHMMVSLVAYLMITGSAYAHSQLTSTVPANGAVITKVPQAINMTFGKKARLIKVVLTKDGASETRLEIPSKSFTNTFELKADLTEPGIYQIEWRALSKDGHALKGSFGFTKE